MNEFKAEVKITKNNSLLYIYEVDDNIFSIEVPRTNNNSHLLDGREIMVCIGILV